MCSFAYDCTSLFYHMMQVGVQCEVQPEAGASALEDKVNAVLPLQHKEGEAPGDNGVSNHGSTDSGVP